MERRATTFTIVLSVLSLIALAAIGAAVFVFTPRYLDPGLGLLFVLAVVLGSYINSQLPQYDPDLILVYALAIVVSYTYGGEAGVIVAPAGVMAAALIGRWSKVKLVFKDVILRIAIATVSVGAAWAATNGLFGSIATMRQRDELASHVWFVSVATIVLICVNLIAAWVVFTFATVPDSRRTFDRLAIRLASVFGAAGIAAALAIGALTVMSSYVLFLIVGASGLAFWFYRRYVNDVTESAVHARSRERRRAELAEEHVRDLESYVEELERTSEYLQESHESFREAAFHDSLTDLPNRNFFIEKLKQLVAQSREKTELTFAILLLDLNRFKTINDSLGHSMGDRLIRNVGKRLSHLVREDDMVARFSGDKFGIILTDLLTRDEATAFAERLTKRIAEPYTLDDRQVFTSVKIGIAFGNSKYAEAEDVLRDADIAMYYAKDTGASYVIFDQKMHIRAVTRLQLETDLRSAIDRNEFELYYQPIIGLDAASLIGFEALVRWNHPQRGLVPPDEFISIAESTGLIVPMTIQILRSACKQVAQWQDRSPNGNPLSVAVNLSGKHFADPNLVDQINTVLDETGIDPGCLKLEITESAIMENAESAILMLKQIKKTGVQISVDDFGTGYSSLSYLHRFPIDLLKVDRSFVSAMEDNTENGEIVRTIIALAKALNLKVVAEGIESIHQFHQLRVLGCEYGQGYLFAKPLPVADVEKLLSDKTRWQSVLPSQRRPALSLVTPDLTHYGVAQ